MNFETKTLVVDLRKLTVWQRLKGSCLLLFRGRFQINGSVLTETVP